MIWQLWKNFKQTVAGELERRFAPSCLDTAKNLPVLCDAVDPRYAHLRFLSTNQKEVAHEELIGQIESLESEEKKEGTADSTHGDEPPIKRHKGAPNKDSAMQFLLGNLSEKESLHTTNEELEHFQREPALDPDSNPLEWWKRNEERFPRLARKLLCIPATSVPSKRHLWKCCDKKEG